MQHAPVLVEEVLEGLKLSRGDRVIDATVGFGGHARKILERIGTEGQLIGIDQDIETLKQCEQNLKGLHDSAIFIHDNFRNLLEIQKKYGLSDVRGILIDCGVSSAQLDNAERGFSFRAKGPVDMRMNVHTETTAADIIRTHSERELADAIFNYGEERNSRRIAKAIKTYSNQASEMDSAGLAEAIRAVCKTNSRIHPATRTYQALRIMVNDEMGALKDGIEQGIQVLVPQARLAILSFQSLEDRMIKRAFVEHEEAGRGVRITKKVIKPARAEVLKNRRARSAKLRIFEKGLN